LADLDCKAERSGLWTDGWGGRSEYWMNGLQHFVGEQHNKSVLFEQKQQDR